MLRIQLLALLIEVILFDLATVSTLPITSKPIENTPEHLAWEAWIMVPPSHEKTRKITPKSIFILPNKTGGGGPSGGGAFAQSTQCPPGHRVDNYKCIPTVSIDRNQILIAQLQNLFHSTDKYNLNGDGNETDSNLNYDYDYDYGDNNYEPDGSESYGIVGNGPPSDYNNEPLKINLSFDKLPNDQEQNKEVVNLENGDEEDVENYDLNLQPFLDENKPNGTSTASPSTSGSTTSFYGSTAENTTVSHISTEASNASSTEGATTTSGSQVDYDTPLSDSSDSSSVYPGMDNSTYSTSAIPILSSTESEMEAAQNGTEDDALLGEETTSHSTIKGPNDDEMELVTENEDMKTDIKEDLVKEALVYDTESDLQASQSTDSSSVQTTESSDDVNTTIFDPDYENEKAETTASETMPSTSFAEASTQKASSPNEVSLIVQTATAPSSQPPLYETPPPDIDVLNHKLIQQSQEAESIKRIREQLKFSETPVLPTESLEANNRFVYHHLGPAASVEAVQSTTPDYREQLRVINKIVEDNKRRAQTESRVRFPDEIQPSPEPQSDFVRFPNPQMFQQRLPIESRITFEESIKPRPVEVFSTPPPTVSSASGSQRNTKPFWWLPAGWEIDKNGQKPLLLRFWSKVSDTMERKPNSDDSSPQSNPTSGYRENSRSPTENLYREISAQDVYKVLGTKNWKQNNR